MKKTALYTSVAFLFLLAGQTSYAQLLDCWAPLNWSANANGTTAAPSITSTTIILFNDNDFDGSLLDSLDCNEVNGTSTACIIVPASGVFTFDWSIAGVPFFYNPFIDRFGYCLNGSVTELSSASPPPFGTSSGTESINVTAGDELCFIYSSKFSDTGFDLSVTINNISTPGCATCDADAEVTGMRVDFLDPCGCSVDLAWDALSGALGYQIEGKVAGAPCARRITTTATTKTVPGLTPGTNYEWRIRARCAGTNIITGFSPVQSFTTLTPRLMENLEVAIVPNPATDVINLRLVLDQDESIHVDLLNSMGQSMGLQRSLQGNQIDEQFNVSELSTGIYWFSITIGDQKYIREVLVRH